MKVAIVYPLPFGEQGTFGGGERYAHELAVALADVVDTVLVTIGRHREGRRVGNLRIETHPWITLVHGLRQNPLSLGFVRSLAAVDVVHCLSYHTLLTDISVLVGRILGKKLFITDVGGGGDLSLARWLKVANLANGLLPISQFAAGRLAGHRTPRTLIYGGVDARRFSPDGVERRRKVLYVGRLLSHKGINYLIEAVDAGVPLVIAGRPSDPAFFRDLQRWAVGKDVTFKTEATDADLIAEYRSSSVVVLPSVYQDVYGRRTDAPELFGLTLLEAMACGAPVICTEVGSLPEVVTDGVTGFVVPPNDSGALARRIASLLDNPEAVREMGARGRASVVERFTWEKVVDRCLHAYAQAHGGAGG